MSMPTLLPNQFFKVVPDSNAPIEGWTIIAVESGYLGEGTAEHGLARVWVIRNDTRTATPELRDYPALEKLVLDGTWSAANGPLKPAVSLEDLPKEMREKVEQVEEERYQLIKPLLELGKELLWRHVRRPELKKRALQVDRSVDHLWQLLCLFWQFGGRHGLRPRAVLAGQKSLQVRVEIAQAKAQANQSGKVSPAVFFKVYKTGPKQSAGVLEGKPLEYADVVQCRRGADKFLFKPSDDGKLRYNFYKAYVETLRVEYDYASADPTKPSRPVPSLEQFSSVVRCDPKFDQRSARIVGPMTAVRSHRQTKDTSQNQVLGPGHVLQIDDMDGKVTLVSAENRLPIGRGRFFAGFCQWSGLVMGAHETLAGSGYEGCRELLINVATPKDRFLADQNIEGVDVKRLPGHGLFAEVAADNGPLRSVLGDMLPRELMSLANLPVYRGDLKPDAESSFHGFLRQAAELLPGFTRVEAHIGKPDPDTIACLTMAEFRTIIWAWIACYNSRVRDGFLPGALLHLKPEDRPANVPHELFTAGVKHVSGSLRSVPDEQIRRLLLRSAPGKLRGRDGILFKGLNYFVDDGKPYRFKSRDVEIRYSENLARQIYVWLDGKRYTASLAGEQAATFGHLSFPEVEVELKHRQMSGRAARSENLRMRVRLNRVIAETVSGAQQKLQALHPNATLRKHLARATGKSSNRNRDRRNERRAAGAKDSAAFPPPVSKGRPPAPSRLQKKSLRDLCRESATS